MSNRDVCGNGHAENTPNLGEELLHFVLRLVCTSDYRYTSMNEIELEEHVPLSWPVFSDLRELMFECICRVTTGFIRISASSLFVSQLQVSSIDISL
jgi:hypothetical protein